MPKRRTINQRVWVELNSCCCCYSRKIAWTISAKMRWMLNAKFFRKIFSRSARSANWLERAMHIPHAYKMDAAAWFGSLRTVFCSCSFLKITNSLHHFAHACVCVCVSLYHGLMKRTRAREREGKKIRWVEWAKYHSSVVVTATFVLSSIRAQTELKMLLLCTLKTAFVCSSWCFCVFSYSSFTIIFPPVYVQKWVEEFDACELSSWPWVPAFVLIGWYLMSFNRRHYSHMNSQSQMVFKSFEKTQQKNIVSFGKLLIDYRGDEEKGDFLKFTRKNEHFALTK